jgi:hypothetical protein
MHRLVVVLGGAALAACTIANPLFDLAPEDAGSNSADTSTGATTTGATSLPMTGSVTGTTGDATSASAGSATGSVEGTAASETASETAGTTNGGAADMGMPMVCDGAMGIGVQVFQLAVADAEFSGEWFQAEHMDEGLVATIDPNGPFAGAVRWTVEIPCADTWFIWARVFNLDEANSYEVQLDGQPLPPAIFETCTPLDGWMWSELSWRLPNEECNFLKDPWSVDWAPGTHEITFLFRESLELGRVAVTNNPDPDPNDRW